MTKRRKEAEVRIAEAVVQYEREYMGRGPTESKAYLIDDMVLIRLKGVITRAEANLASRDHTGRGRDLIKETRTELIEKARPELSALIEQTLGIRVVSLHTDISVRTGERIVLFTLAAAPRLDDEADD